jgi:probable selenium-dependent hydroxylase accessory protein YqeC
MDRDIAEKLVDALSARRGLVAAVGAGGKKTLLLRLLQAHQIIGTGRIALSATVQTSAAPRGLDVETVPMSSEVNDATAHSLPSGEGAFFLLGPAKGHNRFAGLPQHQIAGLHANGGFDVSLIKADGARMRMIKAPYDHEPALPDGATTVLPVVSARALGRPISEKVAHRPERLADIVGAGMGEVLTPDHLAILLSSDRGSLQRVGDARVSPVINMVDTPERLTMAREAALKALARTDRFDRIILASMTSPSPLVDVIST